MAAEATASSTVTVAAQVTATVASVEVESHGVEQRIQFEPGAISTVSENSVVRGMRDRYILYAVGGQTVHVLIASVADNAVFSVEAIDGALDGGSEGDPDVWEGVLPAATDYVITVSAIQGSKKLFEIRGVGIEVHHA